MTEENAHKWNWVLGITIVLMVISAIVHDCNVYRNKVNELKLVDTSSYYVIINNVNTGKHIRFHYPQESRKIDSVLKLIKNKRHIL